MLFVLIGDSKVGYQKTCFNFSAKILTEQLKLLLNWQTFSNYF